MKRSHVLPQDCWIEEKLAPTEEEIANATNELKFFTKEDLSRATALLSSDIIPHGDHEYQNAEFCTLCSGSDQEKNKAYTCLVCQASVCFACRNKHMPKYENGLEVVLNLHPVQCNCTMDEFKQALLRERKIAFKNKFLPADTYSWMDPGSIKLFPHQENMNEHDLSREEQITHGCVPLGAVLFSRSFATVGHSQRTAEDFNGEPTSLMPDFDHLAGNDQDHLPDEINKTEATAEEMNAITIPVRRASYADYRMMDRANICGATAPGTQEQIRLNSHFEKCSQHVQQILNMNQAGALYKV